MSPSATPSINSTGGKVKKSTAPIIKDNISNVLPGKYVRMNKNTSCPTTATTTTTLINAKSLQVKKRKIKHEEEGEELSSLNSSSETIMPKRTKKMKNGGKTFNHQDTINDTPALTVQKKNDNLFHKKGLKLKNFHQQEKKKDEITSTTKSSTEKMSKRVAVALDQNKQCNQERNEKNCGNQVNAHQPTTLSFREQLMANLKGSRFRYLNEMLYTTDGKNAANIFKEDPLAFKAYHDGYRQQVQHWPMNPLDRIIKAIRKM